VTVELVDPFEQILRSLPHALVEYGVLEYRLRLDYPDLFASHVAARGHYLTGSGQATASSVRFAAALLRLDRAGVLTYEMRPATGAWRYNDKVSYWALMPRPRPRPTERPPTSYNAGRSDRWKRPRWTCVASSMASSTGVANKRSTTPPEGCGAGTDRDRLTLRDLDAEAVFASGPLPCFGCDLACSVGRAVRLGQARGR
jgi:hypothetical protein